MERHHRVPQKSPGIVMGFSKFSLIPTIVQIEAVFYPILALVGIPVNAMTIVILCQGKCGLSLCVSHYLVAMSCADFTVILTDVLLNRVNILYFPNCFLDVTPICSLRVALLRAATDISVWLTVAFTFDRFVALCCPKIRARYCNEQTAKVVIAVVCALNCLKNIPQYFIYKPFAIINKIPWGCEARPSFYTAPTWAAFDLIHAILTPFIPFLLILLLNALTVRCIVRANAVRRRLRGDSGTQVNMDPEMENRRKSIVLLFTISGSFIALWVTYVGVFLYRRIINNFAYSSYQDPLFIAERISYMLQLCSCCTNTCIYAVTQSRFREQLNNLLSYTFLRIIRLF